MPHLLWRHACEGREWWDGHAICGSCGADGELDGWHHTVCEAMAVYQYVHGLKPLGPHRHLADELFRGMRSPCPHCVGRGLLTLDDGSAWAPCGACEGTGAFWNRPFAEVDRAIRQVLSRYPAAAVCRPPANFVSPALAHNPATGEIVDLAAPDSPEPG